jgi:hypothetical protein
MTWRLYGEGILEFFFDNINLPDSTSDEPGSHGFVQFSIRPKTGLAVGEVIENTAFIYFDFNEAVVTNTVLTKIEPLNAASEASFAGVKLYPNPAHDRFAIQLDTSPESGEVQVCDLWGRVLRKEPLDSGKHEHHIPIEALPAGVYFVRITESGWTVWAEKVMKL